MTRQSINYKYNIRGWLTDINNVNLGMLGEYQFPMSAYDDLFSFKIMYNEIFEDTGNGAKKLYNGNIAQTFWKTGSNNKLRGYDYSYDSLNRLLRADFYNSEVQPYTGAYQESLSYDLNGNITSLFRTTGDVNGNAIDMDNLTYTYDEFSNQLLKVTDAVSSQDTGGFIDGNTDPMLNDYEYDQNGNMILDRNKGITEIKYNHLNLPTQITWANNKYISYQYNALGQKVGKSVNHSDTIKTVNYLDGFQYAGNVLQFFPTSEGYVKATRLENSQTEFRFNYIYNYTDHLGNVRVSYTLDPQTGKLRIVDEHHYYPFGLRHEVHYPSGNRLDFHPSTTLNGGQVGDPVQLINVTKTEYMYKYNGKEWQDELGLNFYDYGARNYDPAIGRWMNVDPLAEVSRRWSPYTYVYNNPLRFIDPDGMKADDVIITGNKAQEAFKELQKSVDGQLKLSMDANGRVTSEKVKGAKQSRASKKLDKATRDKSIKVYVDASDKKLTSKSNSPNIGVFEGTTVTEGTAENGKLIVITEQSLNPDALAVADSNANTPGATTLHEVIESYIAGEVSQKTGVSSGPDGTPGSIYEKAHRKANRIAPQAKGFEADFYDSQGNPSTNIPLGGTGRIYVNDGSANGITIWSYP